MPLSQGFRADRPSGGRITLIEAMAASTALVATRAGAAETVVVDGQTGVLVPTGDVAALEWRRRVCVQLGLDNHMLDNTINENFELLA